MPRSIPCGRALLAALLLVEPALVSAMPRGRWSKAAPAPSIPAVPVAPAIPNLPTAIPGAGSPPGFALKEVPGTAMKLWLPTGLALEPARVAPAGANSQLAVGAQLSAQVAAGPQDDPARSKDALDPLFTGGKEQKGSGDPVAGAPASGSAPSGLKPATPSPGPRRAGRAFARARLGLGGLVHGVSGLGTGLLLALPALAGLLAQAAPVELPWLNQFYKDYQPTIAGVGVLGATYAVNRLTRWAIEKIGKRAGWQPNTIVAVKLISGIVAWTGGITLGFAAAGASTKALVTSLGLGGVAVTMAAKDFIGNFIEGVKVLINHPFKMEEKIQIGGVAYKVKDMSLRYLEMERQDDAGKSFFTYTQLADKPITLFREYVDKKTLDARGAGHALAGAFGAFKEIKLPNWRRALAWSALGIGLLVAIPFAQAAFGYWLFQSALPVIHGAVVLFTTHHAQKWLVTAAAEAAKRAGWHPQSIMVFKLAVQALAYAVGGSFALNAFGLDWPHLLTAVGASSVAIGWASADVLGNLIQAFWILTTQPFKIGDVLEIAAVKGKVVDMNMQYVVLEHSDRSHTLVPYSVIKASSFSVLDAKTADISPPKPAEKK